MSGKGLGTRKTHEYLQASGGGPNYAHGFCGCFRCKTTGMFPVAASLDPRAGLCFECRLLCPRCQCDCKRDVSCIRHYAHDLGGPNAMCFKCCGVVIAEKEDEESFEPEDDPPGAPTKTAPPRRW